jgi:large subunit ribosomal protein L22
MKAILKNYRQSPRKVRMVADLIRGKTAAEAFGILGAVAKGATTPLKKLLESAVANARGAQVSAPETLRITDIHVDGGAVLKRFMPRARGSAAPIRKRTSTVTLVLSETSKTLSAKR